MDNSGLEKLCFDVQQIIKPVGAYMRQQRQQFDEVDIAKKGVRDFVTAVDMYAERTLVKALSDLLPDSGFVTEENTVEQLQKEYIWIIDPLDGTMNYVHGIPVYSISIALQLNGQLVMGVVYGVAQDEMFYTWTGAPSYLNGEPIQVSACMELQNALIATGFPYIRHSERTQAIAETLLYFLNNGRDIRRLGTAATDLCYVACGRQDVYYEGYLNIWDIAAGILIVQNAGGVAVDFKGGTDFTSGKIVATNAVILPDVLKGVRFFD